MNLSRLFLSLTLLMFGIGLAKHLDAPQPNQVTAPNSQEEAISIKQSGRVIDSAGILPAADLPRFEAYLGWIYRESGIDIRLVFLTQLKGKSIEESATALMTQLEIGRTTGQQRGVLFLYDLEKQQVKIEVGYGLEAWLPDVFIHRLIQNHAQAFFSSSEPSLGLRLMLRLIQHRLREAALGHDFDPRMLEQGTLGQYLSGGAGASSTLTLGSPRPEAATSAQPYAATTSPEACYLRYLAWLADWPLNPGADFLTAESKALLDSRTHSPAYIEFILFSEYGKTYQIVERDNLALMYFTNTPFVSPHFFVKGHDGLWRMDINAEIQNTREHVGGELTWSYQGQADPYTAEFSDLLINIQGYQRFKQGDNRQLPIHGE